MIDLIVLIIQKIFLYQMARSLSQAADSVLVRTGDLPVNPVEVKGYDFNSGVDYHRLLQSYHTTGFQATNMALAVDEINKMVTLYCNVSL